MPGLLDSRFLNSARIQKIIETRVSLLERMRPLTFLDRLMSVNAGDDEIMGRFTAKQLTADIIADDQKASVYESGQVELVINQLANIKIGQNVSQAQLNLLERIQSGVARTAEGDAALDWEQRFGELLVQAVRERMNMMACSMMIDALTYNRLGLQFTGLTWGMPALLKVTVSPLWSLDAGVTSNAANALPFRDILNLDRVDTDNYGLGAFNRVTMSSIAFDLMTQTVDFRNRASLVLGANFALAAGMLSVENRPAMVNLATTILKKQIVLDDKTYREANAAGATATTRVLPANKVLLDRTENGRNEWDWGNAIVTESIVSSLVGATTLGRNPKLVGGGAYGPLGYYTAQSPDMNPPAINGWAVTRGFPRKHVIESSAVLTVY